MSSLDHEDEYLFMLYGHLGNRVQLGGRDGFQIPSLLPRVRMSWPRDIPTPPKPLIIDAMCLMILAYSGDSARLVIEENSETDDESFEEMGLCGWTGRVPDRMDDMTSEEAQRILARIRDEIRTRQPW